MLSRTLPLKRPRSLTPDISGLLPSPDPLPKRLRLTDSSTLLVKPCLLEQLPAEILQQIFFGALNGNLIRASPRIAAKLSSQAVYRTAFFVAFYHQNLIDLRKLHTYLLPDIVTKVEYWELRSMVKLVLDSRWCTWGWFSSLYFELLDDALVRFQHLTNNQIDEGSKEVICTMADRSATLKDLSTKAVHGVNEKGQLVELHCDPFEISITTCSTERTDSDDSDDDNNADQESSKLWHLTLFAFGTIPMDLDFPQGDRIDQRPFRTDFNELFGLYGSYGDGCPDDLWACLDGRIFGAIKQNISSKLRKRLQIDYFFHPEDMPYKISPHLFSVAAKARWWDEEDLSGLPALVVLFDLDPYSLPRESSAIKEWVLEAGPRICEEIADRSSTLSYIKERQAGQIPFTGQRARDFVRRRRVATYLLAMDREIIRYVKDGVVGDAKNLLSPLFSGPTFDEDMEAFISEEEQYIYNVLPTREHYLNKTVSELRNELSNRGVRPYSIGRRKGEYVDRLMLEDQMGNPYDPWLSGYYYGDADLERLVEYVHDLCSDDDDFDSGASSIDDEDAPDADRRRAIMHVFGEDVEVTSHSFNRDLDYVPMLIDLENPALCAALDRKEDYKWFQEP